MEKSLIVTDWRITKASTDAKGIMRWKATTSKFARDIQGDMVYPEFYLKANQRMIAGQVPKPFFSVAHYTVERECLKCGSVYKNLTDYICPNCGRERLIAGRADSIWIDGKQPKAEGIFYPTRLGKSMYTASLEDIRKSVPFEQRARISMGFYPDLDGVRYPGPNQRDFVSGWIEHFAGTRVPVIPETPLSVSVQKSIATNNIRTRQDDALSMIPGDLVSELDQMESRQLKRKSGLEGLLVFKSDVPLPADPNERLVLSLKSMETVDDAISVVDDLIATKGDSQLLNDSKLMLGVFQKALTTVPGNEKAEILARAANLIRAVRDYAHSMIAQPAPVPPTPLSPQTMPENAPQPPIGTVDDQTATLRDLQANQDNQDNAAEQGLADPNEESYPVQGTASPLEGEQPLTTEAGAETDQQFDQEAGLPEGGGEEDQMPQEGGEEEPDQQGDEGEGADEGQEPADQQQPSTGGIEDGGEGASLEQGQGAQQDQNDQELANAESPDDTTDQAPGPDENTAPPEQQPPFNAKKEADKTAKKNVPPPPTSPEEPAPAVPAVPGKKKKPIPNFAKKKSTAAVERVTARTQPDAAVKSSAMHPAEAYVSGWSEAVAGVVRNPTLTRTDKKEKIQKALQVFANRIVGIIDSTTPVTQQDLLVVVNDEVRKALADYDAKHRAQVESLQQQIAELNSDKIQAEIDKTLATVNGGGARVQRKSLTMLPQASGPVPAMTPQQMALSNSNDVRGASARDVARASIVNSQFNPRY